MLPLCEDEVLLTELAAVVHTGWDLPSRPQRQADVRHLLLLSDVGPGASYAEQAHRLLVMLDKALLPDPDDPHLPLDEEDSLGLRILLGTHTRYRTERSPTTRRAEASVYLVPSWHGKRVADRAGSFLRRHQNDALRTALERLRYVYSQDGPDNRAFDWVQMHRHYVISANRQVEEVRVSEVVRARLDNCHQFQWYEPRHHDPGLTDARLVLDTDQCSHGAVLVAVDDNPIQPKMRTISVELGQSLQSGDLLSISWRELFSYNSDAARWNRYFVGCQAPNDKFCLTVSVQFSADASKPHSIWWCALLPDIDPFEVGPAPHQELEVNAGSEVRWFWDAAQTEARTDYLIQWSWT